MCFSYITCIATLDRLLDIIIILSGLVSYEIVFLNIKLFLNFLINSHRHEMNNSSWQTYATNPDKNSNQIQNLKDNDLMFHIRNQNKSA